MPIRTGSVARRTSSTTTSTTTTTTEVPTTEQSSAKIDSNLIEAQPNEPEVDSTDAAPKSVRTGQAAGNTSIHFDENVNVFAYQDSRTSGRSAGKEKMFFMAEMQRYDGWYNNLAHPRWGSVENHLTRKVPPSYSDGVYMMAGADRPSPRALSQALMKGEDGKSSARNLTVL